MMVDTCAYCGASQLCALVSFTQVGWHLLARLPAASQQPQHRHRCSSRGPISRLRSVACDLVSYNDAAMDPTYVCQHLLLNVPYLYSLVLSPIRLVEYRPALILIHGK
jgi:hypothetical protein